MNKITSKEIQQHVNVFLKEMNKLLNFIDECDTMWCDAYIYGWERKDVPQNQEILDTIIKKTKDLIEYCKQVSNQEEK